MEIVRTRKPLDFSKELSVTIKYPAFHPKYTYREIDKKFADEKHLDNWETYMFKRYKIKVIGVKNK